MYRRTCMLRIASALAVALLTCFAQAQDRVWRIGMLETTSPTLNAANLDAFRHGLRELGYSEGRNLIIEYRSADGRGERFAGLAAELVALNVDLIVARGAISAMAAKNATRSIPVVMTAIGDPLLVVPSLAHPGGNVTGISSVTVDLEAKRFGLLRELVPGMVRVAALYNMSSPTNSPQWKEVETAARSVGVQPRLLDVRTAEDLEPAFVAASQQRADGLVVGQDGLFQVNRKLIAELAAKHRLPAIYRSMESIEAGGLMAYGPNYPSLYRQAASYVDKILKGAKPGDLPVEQPKKFELILNIRAARAMGLTIPQSLVLQADELIQ
jgi:putative tryptophan/tyrosine transport system substrate-binding protein